MFRRKTSGTRAGETGEKLHDRKKYASTLLKERKRTTDKLRKTLMKQPWQQMWKKPIHKE